MVKMANYYNITGMMNSTDLYGVTKSLNDNSGGIFAIFFMLISFIIVIMMMRQYEFKTGCLAGLGLVFMEGIGFWALGMSPIDYAFVPLGLIVLNVIWVMWE